MEGIQKKKEEQIKRYANFKRDTSNENNDTRFCDAVH